MTNEKLDITNIRKEDFLEKAFETYLPEELVHKKLGNIHGRKIHRLTDEEEEIIRRYRKFNFKDIPNNWQELVDNSKNRPNITQEKYQELLSNQCKHKPEDLKPDGLPNNWQEQKKENDALKKRLDKVNDMLKILKTEKENK